MSENNIKNLKWQIPEYRKPERNRNWYIFAAIFIFFCVFFSFFSISAWHIVFLGMGSNFLFVLIILAAIIIMVINEGQPPIMVNFELGPEGIKIGRRFHDYDKIKNLSVIYKPKESVKNLYI